MSESHQFLEDIKKLSEILSNLSEKELQIIHQGAVSENPWFTYESVARSLQAISAMLTPPRLEKWLHDYAPSNRELSIGVVMAGNIPLVGFHDLLCVLASGHKAVVKASHQDTFLVKFIREKLVAINPSYDSRITLVERIKNIEAIIATGSDNSARYFEYYFSKYPHIIRRNRTSIAIIKGDETNDQLQALGHDVFDYFGLGCRNVSTLLVPEEYDLFKLKEPWKSFSPVIHHHKYANNYDYRKSINLVNGVNFVDFEFVMFEENNHLFSPISVLYYFRYKNSSDIQSYLAENSEKIQCVVSNEIPTIKPVPFGQAQSPELWDYADGIDTMEFLTSL
ncbi:MAG: acyl-CoA reductase [Cyclobacteriaceae bacterium]|nr:acyl-CoA reductase [Cyclobacteriaceae bacterium]